MNSMYGQSMKINWRFFAREVSSTKFRTRFPSAKAIEELAHFGKLFMGTVPGAIISLRSGLVKLNQFPSCRKLGSG
jgi:hypothetical protein